MLIPSYQIPSLFIYIQVSIRVKSICEQSLEIPISTGKIVVFTGKGHTSGTLQRLVLIL